MGTRRKITYIIPLNFLLSFSMSFAPLLLHKHSANGSKLRFCRLLDSNVPSRFTSHSLCARYYETTGVYFLVTPTGFTSAVLLSDRVIYG